jgi:hypothetical protein
MAGNRRQSPPDGGFLIILLRGTDMKNIATATFMLIACVIGTVLAAAIYFAATFGVLGTLLDVRASWMGQAIGAATTALGFPMGVAVFGLLFWNRLVRDDGTPDKAARTVAVILGLPMALAPLALAGLPALEATSHFKAPGFLVLVGFIGLVGLIERKMRKRT